MDGGDVSALLHDEEGLRYEEEISRNPYILDSWVKYLDFKKRSKPRERHLIHERALKCLPRSYKLWRQYLQERTAQLKGKSIEDKRYQILVNAYERALVHLHKMPRIWLEYLDLLVHLKRGTLTRRTFDRALQALPITQHERIWPLYLEWVRGFGVNDTAVRVFRRYLQFDPMHREEFVDYLESIGDFQEAASQLAVCVNDDDFVSPAGHSKHQLWMRLCDMVAKHPKQVSSSLKVDAIIRSGLARFTDEVGRLWCKLAEYYVRLGLFERARDVYEEGVNSVTTVRDFTAIFDAYAQFEESVITAKMSQAAEEEEDEQGEDEEEADMDLEGNDLDLRLARLEHLMERRPILLSSVLLRQNPHNVREWHNRVQIYNDQGDLRNVIQTFADGVKTVDPAEATGKPHSLWLAFAEFYETHGDVPSARLILERALEPEYRNVDDLASVFTAWAEMELRQAERCNEDGDTEGANECYQAALAVMQDATAEPSAAMRRKRTLEAQGSGLKQNQLNVPVRERVHRSTKVWTLYVDLEESLGTVETCKAAYDRVLELRIATPQLVLNHTAFLEEHDYFEEAFRVFEKAVAVFKWPHVKPLWHQYLDKFLERYGGTKLERSRDLFEQALTDVPGDCCAELFIKYAKLEEEHGLVRRSMAVYDRATKAVHESQKLDMFVLYIRKAEAFYGITKTRDIHEEAIRVLPDAQAQAMSLEYASMERKLGEIDRARAIFTHGAQFSHPRKAPGYWKAWKEFEVNHGNDDTFRGLLRVQRSVATAFAQDSIHDMSASEAPVQSDAEALAKQQQREGFVGAGAASAGVPPAAPQQGIKRKAVEGGAAETDMEALDRQAAKLMAAAAQAKADASAAMDTSNPEEIDLDEEFDLDGEDGEAADAGIQQKAVPAAVFGGLAEQAQAELAKDAERAAAETDGGGMGALARMKRG